jgi:hypothetical protein
MDAVLSARIRRQWPLFATVLLFASFTYVHWTFFRPQADRYRAAIAQAATLGLVLDPSHPAQTPPLPMSVYTVLMDNSLPSGEAEARSQSGTLGAQLAQTLSSMANRRGLEIVVAEPGTMTQLSGSIEIRAHLRLRGRYTSFVMLVDDLARDDRLWALERFTIIPSGSGRDEFDVWMASCLLKRSGSPS